MKSNEQTINTKISQTKYAAYIQCSLIAVLVFFFPDTSIFMTIVIATCGVVPWVLANKSNPARALSFIMATIALSPVFYLFCFGTSMFVRSYV